MLFLLLIIFSAASQETTDTHRSSLADLKFMSLELPAKAPCFGPHKHRTTNADAFGYVAYSGRHNPKNPFEEGDRSISKIPTDGKDKSKVLHQRYRCGGTGNFIDWYKNRVIVLAFFVLRMKMNGVRQKNYFSGIQGLLTIMAPFVLAQRADYLLEMR
jgi:hypothetical protein